MSSVKTSRDALQFEKDIRYWVTASSKSQNRNQKAALFITQLKHIISGSKSGDRPDFSSFQNAEFMQGMYEIFGDALKNPRTAELDWEEIETFIEVNPTSKKRRAQEEDNLSDGDSQHKKPKVSTRNEHEKHSLRASTRGGGSDSTLSSKYRPGSPDDATEPLSGEKATDESSLEVSATQFMCYDPPCVSCVNNHLPCIAPTDPNCLACRMCRLKKTKCSKLEEVRSKPPTSKEDNEEEDADSSKVEGATMSRSQALVMIQKELDVHKKHEAGELSKLRRQVETLERANKNLGSSVEALTEVVFQSLLAQKEGVQGALENVKSLKAKMRRGGA